jgi:methylmalonyl-CoA/ethylmalonyl-CoA epimerase
MILRIDHVSIAVRNEEKARHFFGQLMGAVTGAGAADEAMNYRWQIYSLGDMSRLELIHPTGPGSFLDGFLKEREGGVHHITLQATNIHEARALLEKNEIPYFGFKEYGDYWKELFIHPRDAFGVLIQIAEFHADDFLDESVKLPGDRKWAVSPTDDGCQLVISHPGGGKAVVELSRVDACCLAEALTGATDQAQ